MRARPRRVPRSGRPRVIGGGRGVESVGSDSRGGGAARSWVARARGELFCFFGMDLVVTGLTGYACVRPLGLCGKSALTELLVGLRDCGSYAPPLGSPLCAPGFRARRRDRSAL